MDHPAFFAGVRQLFGGSLAQQQVDRLNAILSAWEQYGDGNPRHLAYILATAKHETGDLVHMREIWGPTAAQSGYEGRADLGNTVKGDGKRFLGRGFVQITGRRNYADWSKRIGLDILSKPTLAEGESLAARILVEGMLKGTFTGRKLSDYPSDFMEARRVVNGTDKAQLIAGYAYAFLAAIERAEAIQTPTVSHPIEEHEDPIAPPPVKPTKKGGFVKWLVIGAIIVAAVVAAAAFIPIPV